MINPLDKLQQLQQAWQSQYCGMIKMDPDQLAKMNPDQLLKTARFERRAYFWIDMFLISVFVGVGSWMLFWCVLRNDIHKQWPWLIYVAGCAWIVVYILFNRWRQRRYAARYDDSVLAHVEWAIKDIEHRMRLDRTQTWWYIMPIALGCMIPPGISFITDCIKNPGWGPRFGLLFELLVIEGVFGAVFYFTHRTMKDGLWFSSTMRTAREAQRRELEALQALRANLLDERD